MNEFVKEWVSEQMSKFLEINMFENENIHCY